MANGSSQPIKASSSPEHVVNAAGLWAREVGRMVGLELPVLAMEHMYLLTEDMPEVAEINQKTGAEVLHAVDFDGEIYLRQERGGMLMGTYERALQTMVGNRNAMGFWSISCSSLILIGLRHRLKSGSAIFRRLKMLASNKSSMAPSRLHLMETHLLGR
jgi:glycine/D-amino acid oxidase-like deaminating enzyme